MKLLGQAALLALSAQAMTVEECRQAHPAGSAALGRCIKAYNKASRAAEQNEFRAAKAAEQEAFHARATAQKDNLRQIKALRSALRRTGEENKEASRQAVVDANVVFADNRKQALLQFALKRMGLRNENTICRRDGLQVSITETEVGSTSNSLVENVEIAIQDAEFVGQFWLILKSGPNVELQSVTVDIGSAELFEKQPDKHQAWNVQVQEEYHGDVSVSAVAGLTSAESFTGDNIWWFYCTPRRLPGTPFVTVEPDNDHEPVCERPDCFKTYINEGGTAGWVVYDNGNWVLPDGFTTSDLRFFDSPFTNAAMATDRYSCADFADQNFYGAPVGVPFGYERAYYGFKLGNACGTLLPANAEYQTIREVDADGAITAFYDRVWGKLIINSSGGGPLAGWASNDCSGAQNDLIGYAGPDQTGNNFYIHDTTNLGSFRIGTTGSCINVADQFAGQNMHVVADNMVWNGGASWVWLRFTQPTPFHHTKMRVDYKGASSIGKIHVHAYMTENLSDCTTVGGHYNPFNVDLTASIPGQHDSYEIGDLSGKHGKMSDWGVTDEVGSKIFHDSMLPLWGRHAIAARGLVIHDDATGARTGCANLGHMCSFWDRKPPVDVVKIDYTGNHVMGYQILSQRQNCPFCATAVKSYFRYVDAADAYWTDEVCSNVDHALYSVCATGSAESKFHIHTIRDESNEWSGCDNNGGHYNPQVGVPCISGYQGPNSNLCELGDLNNKLGKLTISNTGWTTSQATDLYAPLTPSSQGYNFADKSITVHAPSGARLTCGPTDLLSAQAIANMMNN